MPKREPAPLFDAFLAATAPVRLGPLDAARSPLRSVTACGTALEGGRRWRPTQDVAMTERIAEGMNYTIDLDGGVAVCRVWSRPDLDSATGALLATEKIGVFRRLATGAARAMILDLSAAPSVTGPKTQQALGEMVQTFQEAAKPVVVVVGANAIQQLQLRRIVSTFAPNHGALLGSTEEAAAWIESQLRRS
jgi:hypothetical protein